MPLDWRRPIQASAHVWMACGRLGNANVPHLFGAARALWVLERERMRLAEIELGVVQSVPGGRLNDFCSMLAEYQAKIAAKEGQRRLLLADVTRSPQVHPALWRRTPDCIPVLTPNGTQDAWEFPYRVTGRVKLLSNLHLWLSDQRLVSALPKPETVRDDPNLWSWERLRTALGAVTGKAVRPDESVIPGEDELGEAATLVVAQFPWWAELEPPSPYADIPQAQRRIER